MHEYVTMCRWELAVGVLNPTLTNHTPPVFYLLVQMYELAFPFFSLLWQMASLHGRMARVFEHGT